MSPTFGCATALSRSRVTADPPVADLVHGPQNVAVPNAERAWKRNAVND